MMRKVVTSTLLITLFYSYTFSQERCGTTERTKNMLTNLDFSEARNQVNHQINDWIKSNQIDNVKTIITIPVVVHVVWKNNQQNITDNQILSQIEVLNHDFRRTNIDSINTPSVWQSIAADCQIEFCMATIDPNGNPTNGITRTQTSTNSFGMNGDPVKHSSSGGIEGWPANKYLNIWVCNLNNLLGYSTVPSGWMDPEDGVVIGYKYFGNTGTVQSPYNKGRTATHEIGHWLNLEHTWGFGNCGNDNVNDTPKQEEENYGCPSFPHDPHSCGTTNPNGDMFMNYMDYTNDACMNLFTHGQKTRMVASINQYRPSLLNHDLCLTATSSIEKINDDEKRLIKIVDVIGREVNAKKNTPLFYIYEDGTVRKKMYLE